MKEIKALKIADRYILNGEIVINVGNHPIATCDDEHTSHVQDQALKILRELSVGEISVFEDVYIPSVHFEREADTELSFEVWLLVLHASARLRMPQISHELVSDTRERLRNKYADIGGGAYECLIEDAYYGELYGMQFEPSADSPHSGKFTLHEQREAKRILGELSEGVDEFSGMPFIRDEHNCSQCEGYAEADEEVQANVCLLVYHGATTLKMPKSTYDMLEENYPFIEKKFNHLENGWYDGSLSQAYAGDSL